MNDLQLEAAALVERERRRRDFPLFYYEPSRKIAPFHFSRSIIRQLVGGNRSGKTETNVEEAASFALGYRPWVLRRLGLPIPERPWERPANLPDEALCFNGAGIRVKVPNTGLIISGLPMKVGIGEIVSPKLRSYLAPFIDKEWMAHAGTPVKVRLKNGSVIQYASDEQDRMAHEGTAYDWLAVDEPIKKSTYVSLRRGSIDNFAPIWFSYTPLGANANWMFRDLYKPADGKRIYAVTASIFDNDYLTKEAIEEFANDPAIAEAEKEARLYGRFQNLIDRIYPEFDPDTHVVGPFTPPDSWYRGCVVDPHSVKPWAIAWFAISPRGHIYFFREWPTSDFTKIRRDPRSPEQWAALLRSCEKEEEIYRRLMDPNYGPRKDTLRGVQIESVVHSMAKYGLFFDTQLNDDLEHGESQVHRLLYFDPKRPVDSLNRPKLYFTEDCPNLIAAMSFYTAKPRPGTDGIPDESKRDESFKDFADLVRYVAVSDVATSALADTPPSFIDFDDGYNTPDFDGYSE